MAVDTSITVVNVDFLGRDVFADKMIYQILAGNDEGIFSIDNKSGQVSLAKALDFERVAQYQLEVSASDGDANYVGKITVNVRDVSEESTGSAAGCTLHRGADFDPLWFLMLLLAGFHALARSNKLK